MIESQALIALIHVNFNGLSASTAARIVATALAGGDADLFFCAGVLLLKAKY